MRARFSTLLLAVAVATSALAQQQQQQSGSGNAGAGNTLNTPDKDVPPPPTAPNALSGTGDSLADVNGTTKPTPLDKSQASQLTTPAPSPNTQPLDTTDKTTSPTVGPNAGGAGGAGSLTQSAPITVNAVVSTWWNWTFFIDVNTTTSLTFYDGKAPEQTTNSTDQVGTTFGVVVREERKFQTMEGLGFGITDASSIVLDDVKRSKPDVYAELMNLLFNPSEEWLKKGGIGANLVRFPIGASDFGYQQYTYDDTVDGSEDPTLSQFNINKAPKMWSSLSDVKRLQPNVKFFGTPWTPPAWMKGNANGSLTCGSLLDKWEDTWSQYLLKTVQELDAKNLRPYMVSVMNNPNWCDPNIPSTKMTPEQEVRVATKLRSLLNTSNYTDVNLGALEHNWEDVDFAIKVYDKSPANTFQAVLWQCYASQQPRPIRQLDFSRAFPQVPMHMTSCTRITQWFNEPWVNQVKQAEQLLFGTIRYGSRSVILWNGVLLTNPDGFTQPRLPKVCLNCLAPVLVWPNVSTTGQLPSNDNPPGKRWLKDETGPTLLRRQQQQPLANPPTPPPTVNDSSTPRPSLNISATQGTLPEATKISPEEKEQEKQTAASFSSAPPGQEPVHVKAQEPTMTSLGSPKRGYYKLTSDFVTLSHLSRAIRPAAPGGTYAQVIGTTTTEDNNGYPRLFAQTFRLDNANARGDTRFTLLLFQRNDHYQTGNFEDATVLIEFRGQVVNVTVPPGLYTLEWYAPATSPLSSSS